MESNIHLIPTDKFSKLQLKRDGGLHLEDGQSIALKSFLNIYITNDEEIKKGDWFYLDDAQIIGKYIASKPVNEAKKIILTIDQDLIKDGIQPISDEFLQWFVENPSCEMVEVVFSNRGITGIEKILKTFGEYKIILPQEEPKQETLEEAAERIVRNAGIPYDFSEELLEIAKSNAAKEYWYKKFWEDYESQFKNQNNEI
jgi:hypothetical protein